MISGRERAGYVRSGERLAGGRSEGGQVNRLAGFEAGQGDVGINRLRGDVELRPAELEGGAGKGAERRQRRIGVRVVVELFGPVAWGCGPDVRSTRSDICG